MPIAVKDMSTLAFELEVDGDLAADDCRSVLAVHA